MRFEVYRLLGGQICRKLCHEGIIKFTGNKLNACILQVRKDYYTINFKDPEALNTLTCALASHYFDITLDIPSNRLIPTLPLRMNYLLWIEDLLSYHATTDQIVGIDIGKILRAEFCFTDGENSICQLLFALTKTC